MGRVGEVLKYFPCVQINLHIQSERKAVGKKTWDRRTDLIEQGWKKGND